MFQGDNCTVYVLLCIVYPTYYTLFIESTVLASNQCSTLARVCPSQLDEPWILKWISIRCSKPCFARERGMSYQR